jgi:hypothetical protein
MMIISCLLCPVISDKALATLSFESAAPVQTFSLFNVAGVQPTDLTLVNTFDRCLRSSRRSAE